MQMVLGRRVAICLAGEHRMLTRVWGTQRECLLYALLREGFEVDVFAVLDEPSDSDSVLRHNTRDPISGKAWTVAGS